MTIGEEFPEVLAAAGAGDRAAVAALYEDTVPIVRGYLLGQRAFDVDDLVGDVYVSMMSSLEGFSGDESSFRSWLLTIAHRRLVDRYRRDARRKEEAVDQLSSAFDRAGAVDVESQALEQVRTDALLAGVDALTDDQRSVLLLRAVADLPLAQIAEIVGKPETAVKALLRRAVASMARQRKAQASE